MTQRMDNDGFAQVTDSMLRRQFVKGGVAGAASIAFAALAAREASAHGPRRRGSPDYGPLMPVRDMATGLYLLALPRGFRYLSYGWTGQLMDDNWPFVNIQSPGVTFAITGPWYKGAL